MSVASLGSERAGRRALLLRLRVLQLRLWSERLATAAVRGLCLGLAVALGGAAALVVQSGSVERATLTLLALAGLTLGALWSLLRPPSLLQAARLADARYGLEARLGTAVELLRIPGSGRFAEAQLTDATLALRGARGGWPPPVLVAWRECLLAAVMALALVAALQFEGRGASLLVSLPTLPSPSDPDAPERQRLAEPSIPPDGVPGASNTGPGGKTAAAMRTLDELRRARESGTLSREQAASMLHQAESDLTQRAAEARGQRETLDRLARALSQVSPSEAAAESIQRGDYAQAGQQLAQLGQESDQLSTEAKQQLSQALRRAAAESPANPTLADRERRAAEALAGRDYQAAQSSLNALGQEVARAAGQTAGQSELADATQRLEQERGLGASDAPGGIQAGSQAAATGDQRSAGGQAGGSQAGVGEGQGRGGNGSPGDASATRQSSQPAPSDGPAEKADPFELGAPAPRLDVAGQKVEVGVRPGSSPDGGERTERPGSDEQAVLESQTVFDSDGLLAPVQAGGQAERILVPGDQRQVVRDYFGKRAGKGNP